MKTKTSLLVLSSIGLLVSQISHAQIGPALHLESCPQIQEIIVPQSENQTFYMSKDCRTAFILPKRELQLSKKPSSLPSLDLSSSVKNFSIANKELGVKFQAAKIQNGSVTIKSGEAKYKYDVAVESDIAFEFSAKATDFQIKTAVKQASFKRPITQNDISTIILEGALSDTIDLRIGDENSSNPLRYSLWERWENLRSSSKNVLSVQLVAGLDQYLKSILKHLESVKFIKQNNEGPLSAGKGGKFNDCKWKTNWNKKACPLYSEKDTEYVQGDSYNDKNINFDEVIAIELNIKAGEIIPVTHQSKIQFVP